MQNTAWSPLKPKTHYCNQNNLLLPVYIRSLIVQKHCARATWPRTKYTSDKIKYNNVCTRLKIQMTKQRSEDFTKQTNQSQLQKR